MDNWRITLGEIMLQKACQTNAVEARRPTQQTNNGAGPLWKHRGQRKSISQGLSHAVCKAALSSRHPVNLPLVYSKSSLAVFSENSGSVSTEKEPPDLNALKNKSQNGENILREC